MTATFPRPLPDPPEHTMPSPQTIAVAAAIWAIGLTGIVLWIRAASRNRDRADRIALNELALRRATQHAARVRARDNHPTARPTSESTTR